MKNFKNAVYRILIALSFLLGMYFCTRFYILNDVFEDDECRMCMAMYGKHYLQMFLPLGPYSISPIFMCISKFFAEISGYSERVLKLIPYFTIIFSMYMFYKLSAKYFKNSPKTIMEDLKSKYNPHTDVVIFDDASKSSFIFYSIKTDFKSDNIELKQDIYDVKNSTEQFFKNLNPEKNYWLYLIKEFKINNTRENTIKCLEHRKILYSKKDRNSYLYYIAPPYNEEQL